MSGSVAFIQECLTSERERRSTNSNYQLHSSVPHTLQERQWGPVSNDNGKQTDSSLVVCWDHSGFYCAEGSSTGNITIWNFAENTAPYNAFDRQGAASFRSAEQQPQSPPRAVRINGLVGHVPCPLHGVQLHRT